MRAGQDNVFIRLQELAGRFRRVGDFVRGDQADAAVLNGRKGRRQHPAAGCPFDPVGGLQPCGPQRTAAQHQRGLTRPERPGRAFGLVRVRRRGRGNLRLDGRGIHMCPLDIARQNQGGRAGWQLGRTGNDLGHVLSDRVRAFCGQDKLRHGPGQGFNVRGQRRVGGNMPGGMFAHDGHHGRVGLAGVMQIGLPVGQPRTQMEQGQGRAAGDPRIAVGRAGAHPFKNRQHRLDARTAVEGLHQI